MALKAAAGICREVATQELAGGTVVFKAAAAGAIVLFFGDVKVEERVTPAEEVGLEVAVVASQNAIAKALVEGATDSETVEGESFVVSFNDGNGKEVIGDVVNVEVAAQKVLLGGAVDSERATDAEDAAAGAFAVPFGEVAVEKCVIGVDEAKATDVEGGRVVMEELARAVSEGATVGAADELEAKAAGSFCASDEGAVEAAAGGAAVGADVLDIEMG